MTHFEETSARITDVNYGTVTNLDIHRGTVIRHVSINTGTATYLRVCTGTVETKLVFQNELDLRANNTNTALSATRFITGSGNPSAATTGSLASAGSLYINANGTGAVWIKTSQPNGAWVRLIRHIA